MRKELNWYDVNYRHYSEWPAHLTPTDVAIDELNKALNFKWGIACLDEKGNIVTRYTNNVVLDLPDDTSDEKLEEAKKLTAKVLETMWATEEDINDVLSWDPKNETL